MKTAITILSLLFVIPAHAYKCEVKDAKINKAVGTISSTGKKWDDTFEKAVNECVKRHENKLHLDRVEAIDACINLDCKDSTKS